ncbi:Glycosyl transferase family 14 protein [Dioscorea alata]|uniref:Glycosyl transferase family 14 protein n=2 Tax=Dioscorea alata TaxID=55571 RepID=A0ACB7UMQ3_DIOAL|nr:Glycosyl transferase family 14 protein [Dioscorea alata]KAH7661681.1 Glycosyl transferase family 14 protein [Dioscorea alata]
MTTLPLPPLGPLLLLLLSLPLIFFLSPRLLLPQTLISITTPSDHDDHLLRRASLLSSTSPPPSGPPKIAFLFLTISPDLPFSPLWTLFFSSHSSLISIYIHSSPNSSLPSPPPLPFSSSFNPRFIPSIPTSRGSPSLIAAVRRLLAAALLDDPLNAFFTLLSPHCIPLRPFPSFHSTLFSPSPPLSFIEILPPDPLFLYPRYIARGPPESTMLPEIPFSQFRVGSQFFTLSRRHALLVVRDRRLWRKFRLPCLPSSLDSCYPEEHYFPTLLSMMDPESCTNFTLMNVNWSDNVDGHPRLYSPEEVSPELVRTLRKSGDSDHEFMFARKFSPECLNPLMDIAQTVILKEE